MVSSRSGSLRRRAALGAVFALAVAGACSSDGSSSGDGGGSAPADGGSSDGASASDGQLSRQQVEGAVADLEPLAADMLESSGVPGMAIAVVHQGEVVFAEGFGVKEVGSDEPVDADTVFQLASLSKPISSTVVAGLVGDGEVAWDDPMVDHTDRFVLSEEASTEGVTFADLFSHRSGLPDHAGDLLEDLGYDREEIVARLRYLPLAPIRSTYAYTNFGLTEAAVVAAEAAGTTWDDAARDVLFDPAGMDTASYRYEDYLARENRATIHALRDGEFVPSERQPDEQAPAGGVSASVNDLVPWMRLTMDEGQLDGETIVDPDALAETKLPHATSDPPRTPDGPAGLYGLGWGVGQNDHGDVTWTHSGAFLLGTGTQVTVIPAQELAIVTLTNGTPVGLPEAVARTFSDLLYEGEPTGDWLERFGEGFASMRDNPSEVAATGAPADPVPPRDAEVYVGTYGNDYFGPLTVSEAGDGLVMTLGPDGDEFALTPVDGDVFTYEPVGENAVGPAGVTFLFAEGAVDSVTVENLDEYGLGTFLRQ